MSNHLIYEYRPQKNGPIEIRLDVAGNVITITEGVGRLIQQLYFKLPDNIRPAFKAACQGVTADDSPVRKQSNHIMIDLSAMRAQPPEQ